MPEAVWLVRQGFTDVVVSYPSVDREWSQTVAEDELLRDEITIAVDSVEHVRFLADLLGRDCGVRVALDVDCSLRVGRLHLGVRRSPPVDVRRRPRRDSGRARRRPQGRRRDVL